MLSSVLMSFVKNSMQTTEASERSDKDVCEDFIESDDHEDVRLHVATNCVG